MPSNAKWLLLQKLREYSVAEHDIQQRLNLIVDEIAAFMEVEVCSIYLQHGNGTLELYATYGLNLDSVHKVMLQNGEGLVGLIAEMGSLLNIADSQSHYAFSDQPSVDERDFHAFMGCPILKEGRTLGVLTIQNRFAHPYGADIEDLLQTIAMMLSTLLTSDSLKQIVGVGEGTSDQLGAKSLRGESLHKKIALGHVVLHEPRIEITSLVSKDPKAELKLLDKALHKVTISIDALLENGSLSSIGQHRDVLEAYKMFAQDKGWIRRLREAISSGLTAQAAVGRVQNETRARLMRQSDPFFRERLHDLDDLSNRLLRELVGRTASGASGSLPSNTIVVARAMGPAELLDYSSDKLRGVVLQDAGISSHITVIARAMGIAAVGGVNNIVDLVEQGDPIIVDGENGEVHIRPGKGIIKAYENKVRFQAEKATQYRILRDIPNVTKDGTKIALMVNMGMAVNFPHYNESGADGIGLFRTELEFMLSSEFPDRKAQVDLYQKILDISGERPVVFRTLDVGGDKLLPYMTHDQEENPAMGWRAIRMSLDRPMLFSTQVDALLEASADRVLYIMMPMIADAKEMAMARQKIERQYNARKHNDKSCPKQLKIGAMIEVPSILWQLDQLLPLTDFVSVGTNDLMQFLFAADRANMRVAHRFDMLNISVLRVVRELVEVVKEHKVPLTICGEMAGHPVEALALLGLGVRSLSMAPAAIGPVKAALLSTDLVLLERIMMNALKNGQGSSVVRQNLQEWIMKNQIDIGWDR